MVERLRELHAELGAVEETISKWCMRMAWPGGTPTPPFQAWEKRAAIYDELRTLGIERPNGFHRKPRP
jgi:hypothetical protein